MIDDIISKLRWALTAGPTPGQWSAHGTAVFLAGHGGFDLYHCPSPHSNAQYIATASPDNITALLGRLEAAERENERLRKFSGKVLAESRMELADIFGGDIQDWADQCGLLEMVTATAACGDDCKCAEWSDFPTECFRPTDLGRAAIDAAMAAEPSDAADR